MGHKVEPGQIYVNKEEPTEKRATFSSSGTPSAPGPLEYRRTPLSHKSLEPGVIDKVMLSMNNDAMMNVKVNIRQVRRPELGDKFSSRHGQKGVCGLIVRQEDMPFNDYGVSPDIIMNPRRC